MEQARQEHPATRALVGSGSGVGEEPPERAGRRAGRDPAQHCDEKTRNGQGTITRPVSNPGGEGASTSDHRAKRCVSSRLTKNQIDLGRTKDVVQRT